MPESDLKARLAQPGTAWRELAAELRGAPDLEARLVELEAIAEGAPDVDVRYRARKVLGYLDAGRARFPVLQEPPPPLGELAQALEKAAPAARAGIVDAFAQTHRTAGVDEIVKAMGREPDPQLLSVMARLVGQFGNAGHLRDLRPLLSHPSPRVVANAVEAMGRCDAGAALPTVLPALMAEDHRVRANVLVVLYAASREETVGYLSRMAQHPQESYRAAAIWCLSQIKDPEGEDVLLGMLKDEESAELADMAANVLAEIGARTAIGKLRKLSRMVPARAARTEPVITRLATRLAIDGPELELELAAADAPAGISGKFKVLSKSIQMKVARKARQSLQSLGVRRAAPSRHAIVTAVALSCMLLGLVYVNRRAWHGRPRASWTFLASSPRPVASRGKRRPGKPGGPVKLVAKVSSRVGSTLVMKKDYTVYAVKFRDPKQLAKIAAGQTVSVVAKYRSWNPVQGYVELDATGGPRKP